MSEQFPSHYPLSVSQQHKQIIQSQGLVLLQQKNKILYLVTQLEDCTRNTKTTERQIDILLQKHNNSPFITNLEETWKLKTYIQQLQEQHSLIKSKLHKHKSNPSSEENITLDDLCLNVDDNNDAGMRYRNSSISSTQISTDNDEICISACSMGNITKSTNPMVLSGVVMSKTKMEKYKIAQTFYDNKAQILTPISLFSEDDEMYSLMINYILERSQSVEQIRKNLANEEVQIPHSQRARLWPKLIGTKFQIPNSYYQSLKLKLKDIDPLFKKLINGDITRTFPELYFFNSSSDTLEDLRQVLEMFQVQNPVIGYVQGMAHLASMLLLVFNKQKAFECFNNLILGWSFIKNLYSFDQKDYQQKLNVLCILINQFVPRLNRKISFSQLQLLMIQWFFAIFSRNFNINVAIKIWDLILVHGQYMFYSVAVAILKLFTNNILQVSEDQVYLTVKELTATLDYPTLQQSIKKLNLTSKDYDLAIKRFEQ